MGIASIGAVISKLRKDRNVTQEALARWVGVSAQAVSKWENGGLPDTELLPKIADYFGVSIDTLFGRGISDYNDIPTALIRKIAETEPNRRFEEVFELCWDIQRAMFGAIPTDGSVKEYKALLGEEEQRYSSVLTDQGFTLMGIANRLQYFLVVPEPQNKNLAFFNGIDYTELFRDLSDETFFETLVFLSKRKNDKCFTHHLLINQFQIDFDQSLVLIKTLDKYGLLQTTQIETNDTVQKVYRFVPTPSFTALLIFARELIDRPNAFSYYLGGRNKPYLE